MNLDKSSMVLVPALSSTSLDCKQSNMLPNLQFQPNYQKSSYYKKYNSHTQQMSDELQQRFAYQRPSQHAIQNHFTNHKLTNDIDSHISSDSQSGQTTILDSSANTSDTLSTLSSQKQPAKMQLQSHQSRKYQSQDTAQANNSQDIKRSRQCLGALDCINLPSDSYQHIPERRFMSSLLKHTGIALIIIVSLAAITVYAAEANINNASHNINYLK